MNSLRLSPLPSIRNEEDCPSLQMEREGFVDEAVVAALVSGPRSTRSVAYPEDLVLAVDDMDYAGWQLSPATPFRGAEVPPQVIDAIVRRASPPVIDEPGIGAPHLGSHRWWLAGLAGVLSTMLFSVLLLTLSSRQGIDFQTTVSPKALVGTKPAPLPKAEPAATAPELTASSAPQP
ncbi:MAG: hypothetical protein ABIS50_05110 [Luteolibacter sp.]|uniref:hypothetical protein n=1 Tax=Luteolibacter sp. TaxID=1962973 RepID=UPI003264D4FA